MIRARLLFVALALAMFGLFGFAVVQPFPDRAQVDVSAADDLARVFAPADEATVTRTTPTTTIVPVDAQHALVHVVNKYDRAAAVGVQGKTGHTWLVEPRRTTGAALIETTTEHSDGANVGTPGANGCGLEYGGALFVGGHTYEVDVVASPHACPEGYAGPNLTLRDLTTGALVDLH